MFCMNCGSKLPDFAKFCFNCGFSVEKMFEENVEDDIAVKVENSQNVIIPKEEKFITFEILEGMKLSYVEGTDKISKYMGIFVNIMNEMSLDLYHKYNESKGIKSLLENTYNSFYCYMKKAVETACDILGENEIYDIGKTRFVKEYIQEYLDIYDDNYNQVVNEYFSILEDRDAMAAYRDAQKANRSRWVGGGFGIRGAIKGSIKASVLNAGFDFLHGIGDSMNESADNEEMNKKLASLYKKKSTRDILCNQPMILILGVYDELREILIDKLELSEKSAIYDVGRAAELFGDTVNSNYPNERKKENFVKCIGLFPAETKYYEAIIDDIFNQGKQGEVIRFLNFWGIDESFLEDLLDNCKKMYGEQKNSNLLYTISEKRSNYNFSKVIDSINSAFLEMKELKDFISYFNDLSSRAGYFATEKGNVNLLNKVKVYLQEKNNYTCPIIAYIDDGAFFSKGQRGIVIGTEELIFLLEDRIIHLLYSGIKQIMYVKDGDYVYFNYDKTYSWKLPSIGTDDTYKILAFVILKIVKRQGEGYQLPINIMRDGKESM